MKIKSYFSYKHRIPDELKSFLVYKFTCASCSSSYTGETGCQFKTRIEEHSKKSQICKYLHSAITCFDSYNSLSFQIIDKTNSKFDLKIKEGLHFDYSKLSLNAQQNYWLSHFHYSLRHLFVSCCLCFFSILFHLLFSLSLTLIVAIFYCFNYTSLLIYPITTFFI